MIEGSSVAVAAACIVAGACTGPRRPLSVSVMDASPPAGTARASSAEGASNAPAPPAFTVWTRIPGEPAVWGRAPGEHAPPLVVRGVVTPTAISSQDYMGMGGAGFDGARFGTEPLRLRVDGAPRTLHVWGRARGPIGLRVGPHEGLGVVARSGAWAKLDLASVTGDLEVDIADVDVPGERRGQTSPYVVVVRDDEATPAELPDERAPLASDVVTVRWSLSPAPPPEGEDGWSCARIGLELRGAVRRDVALKPLLRGQSGCWPDDTGVFCNGASGSSSLTVSMSANGNVDVAEYTVSDGYCEPDAGACGNTTKWTSFKLPPGLRLAPDPLGTFPPQAPAPP
jgi:hypothetical protein